MNRFNFPSKRKAAECCGGFLPLGNLDEFRVHDIALVDLTLHRYPKILSRAFCDGLLDVRNRRGPHLPNNGSMVRSMDLLSLGGGAKQACHFAIPLFISLFCKDE